jgi:hypothetical protein
VWRRYVGRIAHSAMKACAASLASTSALPIIFPVAKHPDKQSMKDVIAPIAMTSARTRIGRLLVAFILGCRLGVASSWSRRYAPRIPSEIWGRMKVIEDSGLASLGAVLQLRTPASAWVSAGNVDVRVQHALVKLGARTCELETIGHSQRSSAGSLRKGTGVVDMVGGVDMMGKIDPMVEVEQTSCGGTPRAK